MLIKLPSSECITKRREEEKEAANIKGNDTILSRRSRSHTDTRDGPIRSSIEVYFVHISGVA